MSKSFSAKVMSEVLELFSMFMDKNNDKLIENALQRGEKPSPPSVIPKTRYEDTPNGRVFHANEDSKSGITVFYLHGGAYFMDFTLRHWKLMDTMIRKADVELIAPAYRCLPFATWRETFDLLVPLYRDYCQVNFVSPLLRFRRSRNTAVRYIGHWPLLPLSSGSSAPGRS